MTLRQGSVTVTAVALGLLLAVLYGTAQLVLLGRLARLEASQVRQSVGWAQSALSDELENLQAMTASYAAWDDMYLHAERPNPTWATKELAADTLPKARIHAVMIVNDSAEIVTSTGYRLSDSGMIPVPADVREFVLHSTELLHPGVEAAAGGLVRLPSGPALIASRAIVHSDGSGPARGALIMVRYLDDDQVKRLASTTHLSLTLVAPGSGQLPGGLPVAAKMSDSATAVTREVSDSTLEGYVVLPDFQGRPALGVVVSKPRDIYQQARTALHTLLGIVVFFSVVLFGGLVVATWRVTRSLQRLSVRIGDSAAGVSGTAYEVARSAESLSQGSTEQTTSLRQTSTAMDEMTGMTRRNAERSRAASVLMTDVDDRVAESNGALAAMVTSMAAIQDSSQKVARIIRTIDEIAFQTNILALNAAVEAARAGVAGAGFAVVADEVRNLAQRSADAAKDTASLIEESVTTAQGGATQVAEVEASIAGITDSVTKLKGLVEEVSVASGQQEQGIQQVLAVIDRMQQITEGTASTAHESMTTVQKLHEQVGTSMSVIQELDMLVGHAATPQTADRSPVHTGAGTPETRAAA